jgi:hypothetical protein
LPGMLSRGAISGHATCADERARGGRRRGERGGEGGRRGRERKRDRGKEGEGEGGRE